MLFLWFYHACRRMSPRFLMVADHANYLTFEDPGAVATVRRALKLAEAGDLLGAAETAGVDTAHAAAVSEGMRRGMRFAIGAEVDNDPRARPDAQNIVEALRPDGVIRTVHFVNITHPEKGADWAWAFDSEEFASLHEVVASETLWELYTAKLLTISKSCPRTSSVIFMSPRPLGQVAESEAARRLRGSSARDLPSARAGVEINTRFLYRDHSDESKKKYLDANARLVRKAKARRVGIAIGSDAHSPRDQGNAFDGHSKDARRSGHQRDRSFPSVGAWRASHCAPPGRTLKPKRRRGAVPQRLAAASRDIAAPNSVYRRKRRPRAGCPRRP